MLDALGEDARSRGGVSQRPLSGGAIGLKAMGIGMKVGIGVGVGNRACALDWPSEVADFSPTGGNRSFSISERRLTCACR